MYNHYFNEQGEYQFSTQAYLGSIPSPDSLRADNEIDIPEGFWPVLNAAGDGWNLVEDHRGKEGWVLGERIKIATVGPLPEGWSDTQPAMDDTRSPEEKRQAAYTVEADGYFYQAQFYQAEAEGLRLLDKVTEAATAEETAHDYLRRYAERKAEIRARFPDDGKTRYFVGGSNADIYHKRGCGYAPTTGFWKRPGEIKLLNMAARPCEKCKPPAIFYVTDAGIYHTYPCAGVTEPGIWKDWAEICDESSLSPCKTCLDVE